MSKSICKLNTANGNPLKVLGKIFVNVECSNGNNVCLPVVVLDKDLKRSLLGREWLSTLNPNWRSTLLEGSERTRQQSGV